MLALIQDLFGGIDLSDTAVQRFVFFFASILVLAGLLLFLLVRKARWFVPKSKLYNDEYVRSAAMGHRRRLRFFRIGFGVCAAATLVFSVLEFSGLYAVLGGSLVWWYLGAVCGTMVFLPLGFGRVKRRQGVGRPARVPTSHDVEDAVARKRAAVEANKAAGPRRRATATVFAVAFGILLLALLSLLAFYRGLGLFGLWFRLFMLCLAAGGAIPAMVGAIKSLRRKEKGEARRALSTLAVAVVVLAGCAFLAVAPVRDIISGPVTRRVEVTSLVAQHIYIRDTQTGEASSLRTSPGERYTSLADLWAAYKTSRVHYGDSVARRLSDEEDRPLYCTITFYLHTGHRVSVEDIEIG